MRYLILGLVVLAGMFQPAQVAANNRLRKAVESSSLAAFLSFLVGCAALLLVLFLSLSYDRGRLSRATGSPWWAWIGGLSGAFSVFIAIVAAQRTDVSSIVAFTVAAQLAASIVVDHFGWLDVQPVPASFSRAMGGALLVVGAFLVHRR